MDDMLSSPRLQRLLDAADEALERRVPPRPTQGAEPSADELSRIYRDLGEALHLWVRTGSAEPPRPRVGEDDTTAFVQEDLRSDRGSWYTDEVERSGDARIFDEDELGDDQTEIPETDTPFVTVDISPEDDEYDEADDGWEVITLDQLRRFAADPTDPLGELQEPQHDPAPWLYKLDDLLRLIELPADPTDPQELSVEASKVQWACSDLAARLGPLPDNVQLAVIALLGARAQHLRRVLDVDVGPKLALDRLRRYRLGNELPTVVSLTAEPAPETGAWSDDIAALWSLLQVRHIPRG